MTVGIDIRYSVENAISARKDLNSANGNYNSGDLDYRCQGGIESK